jgi:hypothetical protein
MAAATRPRSVTRHYANRGFAWLNAKDALAFVVVERSPGYALGWPTNLEQALFC